MTNYKMKTVATGAEQVYTKLSSSGLLLQVNKVLHASGFALGCSVNKDDSYEMVLLKSDDPAGIVFHPELFNRSTERLFNYEHHVDREARLARYGNIIDWDTLVQNRPGGQ